MIADIVVSFFLVLGGIFGLVGSVGLIKLGDAMSRLHAPTKATTLGVGGVLLASMSVSFATSDSISFHELLITLFLFLTAPITGHFIAKAHLHNDHRPKDLPATGTDRGWASYDDPGADAPSPPAGSRMD